MTEVTFPTELVAGLITGCVMIIGYILYRSVYRIEQGHLGVITTFGAADFSDESTKTLRLQQPGLHTKKPWQRVREFTVMERIKDLTSYTGGFHAIAEDGTILRIGAKLRMQPAKETLYAYLFELKNPVAHIHEYFKCLLRNEIANFKDSYSGIRKNRQLLNEQIDKLSKTHIGNRYGVKFNAVDIFDIVPPEELDRALNAVQNAQAEMDAQYSRALADRDQRLTAATQALEIASHRAQATEIEITVHGENLRKLKNNGMLSQYLDRRKTDVYSGAKLSFIKH